MLRFTYRNAKGIESVRTLISWTENSCYIQGRSADSSYPKLYRKDRIIDIELGAELLLGEKAPPVPRPAPKAPTDARAQIQFTGFSKARKAELAALASEHGLRVMTSPGKNLAFLCCGANAGPAKIANAHLAGALILSDRALVHLLDTGEILDVEDPE